MSQQPIPPNVLQRIDEVCDAFERAWRSGECPRIETFLAQGVEPRGEYLRELLARELELRREAGEAIDVAEYEKRFEGFLDLVRTLLIEPEPDITTGEEETVSNSVENTSGHPVELDRTDASTMPYFFEISQARIKSRNEPAMPAKIGRFRPLRRLGRGNFDVFLADDELTGTQVALKVTRADDPFSRRRMTSLAAEAQRMAALQHPGIVKVHEFVIPTGPRTDDSIGADGFIVLEYVDGQTLETLLESPACPALPDLMTLLADVADAVHHAHLAGMVHRDLKPSNILIDSQGHPRVCDFGLAIKSDWVRMTPGQVAGTLFYMAPEQVRGQTSNLDGRTDVWALGVILYRVLTGRLPFWGSNAAECFEEILQREPRPPRQIIAEAPRQLERICLRCLSKSLGDRYLTAADFAEELRRWHSQSNASPCPESRKPAAPRGFRPFTGDDSASFLSLLGDPAKTDELPESIRFWKAKIEAEGDTAPFGVGVIHGPCGAGKTSFVRAGLIPLLDRREIRTLEITCETIGTEARLFQALRSITTELSRTAGLEEAIAAIQTDRTLLPNQKVLLVLDQFERCLMGHANDPSAELFRALSRCDGNRVQALLVVRDPFWNQTRRLLRSRGIPVIEGENARAVEPPNASQARSILEQFGRGLGRLSQPDPNSDAFLDQVVHGLETEQGGIAPFRISILAEAMRQRAWTLESLAALGGIEGIERRYVRETLDTRTNGPASPMRQALIQPVLKLLLSGTENGKPRLSWSSRHLREAAGCKEGDPEFIELLRTLDEDLRWITVVPGRETTGINSASDSPSASGELYYRLAHEFLAKPLRHWIDLQGQGARMGPAYASLQAITANWQAKPSNERLPAIMEWLTIRRRTLPAHWTDAEYRLMSTAFLHYAKRLIFVLLPIVALGITCWCLLGK